MNDPLSPSNGADSTPSNADRVPRTHFLPKTPVTLLQRIREFRDPTAMEELLRLLAPLVDFWVRRSIPERHDRADVAQEVFLQLVRTLPKWDYDSAGSFRAWLRTVTRTRCIDFLRKRGKARLDLEPEELAAREIPDGLEAQESKILLQSAMQILKGQTRTDQWEIFTRYVLEEERAADVAQRCGVELNFVYLVRSRLLARLRALLTKIRE